MSSLGKRLRALLTTAVATAAPAAPGRQGETKGSSAPRTR